MISRAFILLFCILIAACTTAPTTQTKTTAPLGSQSPSAPTTMASAPPAKNLRFQLLEIPTRTYTDQEFLTGSRNAKPVTIAGELRIPRPGTDRLPTVVLLHASGGISSVEDSWARHLNSLGVATFIIDSFTARGINNTVNDQDQLSRWNMIVDAYRALDVLAKHPRIDANRILLMGFSRGGGAGQYASVKRFWTMYGPASGIEYAGYIAFYPTCNRVFQDGLDVVNKPIRMFHGIADDYIPIAECRMRVDQLKAAGKDVVLTEYPGAYHVFDNPTLPQKMTLPQAQTTRNCPLLEESADGQILDSRTRHPFTYASDPCVERGVTIGYNAEAHANAVRLVTEFVTKTLNLK